MVLPNIRGSVLEQFRNRLLGEHFQTFAQADEDIVAQIEVKVLLGSALHQEDITNHQILFLVVSAAENTAGYGGVAVVGLVDLVAVVLGVAVEGVGTAEHAGRGHHGTLGGVGILDDHKGAVCPSHGITEDTHILGSVAVEQQTEVGHILAEDIVHAKCGLVNEVCQLHAVEPGDIHALDGVDGFTLGMTMQQQAEKFSVTSKLAEVTSVDLSSDIKILQTSEGTFYGKTVIIATGAEHKHLGIAKENELTGKGISYCATCDGMFYRNKTVAVVGGGNSAAADAKVLSRIAKKVILIHRRDTLRATKVDHDPLKNTENLELCWNSEVSELLHENTLNGLKIRNVVTGEESVLEVDGLFISIGRTPVTALFADQLELDPSGYIKADESTQTNLPGVYAIGDVRTKVLRQIVTAVADGAVAAHYAEEYLAGL